jgi:transposase
MITTTALSFHILYYSKRQNMTILTRQERERLVLDLYYNQGKTYREISKEARISPRDIGNILNKTLEERTEGIKEEQQEQHLSLSTQAYKLFSERKTPLQVAIALNVGESEATKFCKEYWKLKQLHNLNTVYEEIKDDIASFLELYRLSKAKGMGVNQVVNLLTIANNDLPAIEERFKRLRNDVGMLQSQKHACKRNLYQLKNQIAATTQFLNSLRILYRRERRAIEDLFNEKSRLEALITEFKSNNKEYIKIRKVAGEQVKDALGYVETITIIIRFVSLYIL